MSKLLLCSLSPKRTLTHTPPRHWVSFAAPISVLGRFGLPLVLLILAFLTSALSDPFWGHPVTMQRQRCGILPGCLAKRWNFPKVLAWKEPGPRRQGVSILSPGQPLTHVFQKWENGGEVVENSCSYPSCSNQLSKSSSQFPLFYVFLWELFFSWVG